VIKIQSHKVAGIIGAWSGSAEFSCTRRETIGDPRRARGNERNGGACVTGERVFTERTCPRYSMNHSSDNCARVFAKPKILAVSHDCRIYGCFLSPDRVPALLSFSGKLCRLWIPLARRSCPIQAGKSSISAPSVTPRMWFAGVRIIEAREFPPIRAAYVHRDSRDRYREYLPLRAFFLSLRADLIT